MDKVFSNEPIENLDLSVRVFNSLRRVGIETVEDLLLILESGEIESVRNIGELSIKEIQKKLEQYEIIDVANKENELFDLDLHDDVAENTKDHAGKVKLETNYALILELSEKVTAYREVFSEISSWQIQLFEKQIEQGLLHSDIKFQGKKLSEILHGANLNQLEKLQIYSSILISLNISDELRSLLQNFSSRNTNIFLQYYGFNRKTLEQISVPLGITRERVRQILGHIERKIYKNFKKHIGDGLDYCTINSFPRMQTALCYAEKMGWGITYHDWSQYLIETGLIGSLKIEGVDNSKLIELFLSICNLMEKNNIEGLKIPSNLRYAILLAADNQPHTPAKTQKIRSTLPKEIKKEIRRHTRFTGAVNAKWMSHEINHSYEETQEILIALGYYSVKEDWYISQRFREFGNLTRFNAFENTINKMLQFCGPLKTKEICSGLRHAVSRTEYPVPPAEVVKQALELRGYNNENGLWSLGADIDDELNSGEKIIFSCLENYGPVLHHSEIAQAFIDSDLSFPAIHATLNRSPLFEKVEHALYKLRGTSVTYEDIARASNEGDKVPVNLEVIPGKTGVIRIFANLGLLPVGTGVFFSENLPKLTGEWQCILGNHEFGEAQVTENEIRGLLEAFEFLGCETGDRVCFSFNTWDRTISIEKI
jgi:hypothetical protein